MSQRRLNASGIILTVALLLVSLVLVNPPAKAPGPTYVAGNVSGIWDLEGSPYVAVENLYIPPEQRLVIGPGVEVRFNTGAGVLVHGSISVEGTENMPVLFTSNQTIKDAGQWSGIMISISSTDNTFDYMTLEYATNGISCTEASSVSLRNSLIRRNSLAGVNLFSSSAIIKATVFTENNAGIIANNSEIDIIESNFSSNVDGALSLFYSTARVGSTHMAGNHDALMAFSSDIWMENSTIQTLMSPLWLREASWMTATDSFLSWNESVFSGASSTLIVQWTLSTRVVDRYSSGVAGALVTLEGALVDPSSHLTGPDGWIETLTLKEFVKTNLEKVSYNPYWINASTLGYVNETQLLINEPLIITLRLPGDVVPPEASAGHDLLVDEDKNVILDASGSWDDDPDFFSSGSFTWTFYDYDGHYVKHGVVVSYTFRTPGKYSVKLRAEDSFGNWDVDYLEVHVMDTSIPHAVAQVPDNARSGETVVFDASNSSDNDPAFPAGANFTWSVIHGREMEVLYGCVTEYSFPVGGTYIVSLKVRDAAGNFDVIEKEIKVAEKQEVFSYLPFIALALIGSVLAGVGGTEVGRYWFLKFLILPLYMKLSKKDILDHFIRGQIYGYLVVHPGDNYTTIKRNLNLKNGTLTYHLDVLEREGFIKSQVRGGKRHYYPRDFKMPENGTGFPAIKEDMIRRVKETPGITIRDLASLLGVSRQLTNYHLKELIQEGYIYTERRGVRMRLYPAKERRHQKSRQF